MAEVAEKNEQKGQLPPKEGEVNQQYIPKSRFDEVNEARKQALAELEAIRAAEKKREEEALAEQQRYKELAEQRAAELEQERARNLRLRVATKLNVPDALVDRLQGSTEEEVQIDAEKILAAIEARRKAGAGAPPPPNNGTPKAIDMSDPQAVRENAAAILEKVKR